MEIRAIFSEDGFPQSFYSPDIHGDEIPAEAVSISQPQWLEFISNPGRRQWRDGEIIEYAAPSAPPTSTDVDRERDLRIASCFGFNGKVYQSSPEDRENIQGASTAALAAIFNGAQPGDYRWHGGDSDFEWIAADNSTHPLDAQTTFAMGQAAMAHKQAHIFAARTLKDMDPIPPDYTEDQYWPQMPSRQTS